MKTAAADLSKPISIDPCQTWEDSFLNWFAQRGLPIVERKLQVGGFQYYHFATAFTAGEQFCMTHGRSQSRKIAALKCAAECVEREVMLRAFKNNSMDIPRGLRSSNGWAVHKSIAEAQNSSVREALERHLLLKSFLLHGWAGFRLVEKIETDTIELFLLTSVVSVDGFVSGLVAAKSHEYPGISIGYCFGDQNCLHLTSFWESAIFEAVDKIMTLQGRSIDLSIDPESWILAEIKHFLEVPFDLSLLSAGLGSIQIRDPWPAFHQSTFDVGREFDTDFSVYASFTWGGDLIPLFHKARARDAEMEYIKCAMDRHGMSPNIPERHPIL